MLLGGIHYLLPAIETAHRHGYYVITVDFLPNNIAHHFSDEYHNVSITDKEAVLELAKKLKIDGILSFAVDPGVVTAAYVAEKMNLPFQCSYEAACILQDKAKFRQFLTDNNFNVPVAKGYSKTEVAQKDIHLFNWPVIVKPVDSAGSKGVTRVDKPEDLLQAIQHALKFSLNGRFVIEDFIEKDGMSSGSESFAVEGELQYNGFYDQYFDNEAVNPFTPSGECWPTNKTEKQKEEIRKELQRLFNLLHVKTGLFNVEWRVGKNGLCYLMEVSPRAGGNRLAEMLNIAADVDIIEAEIQKAVGGPLKNIHEPHYKQFHAILVLHNEKAGLFRELKIDEDFFKKHVIEKELRVKPYDFVEPFTGANTAIGTLFLKFESRKEMEYIMENHKNYVKIIVE